MRHSFHGIRAYTLQPTLEEAHNKAELTRATHPGRLEFYSLSIDYLSSLQQELTNVKNSNSTSCRQMAQTSVHR